MVFSPRFLLRGGLPVEGLLSVLVCLIFSIDYFFSFLFFSSSCSLWKNGLLTIPLETLLMEGLFSTLLSLGVFLVDLW